MTPASPTDRSLLDRLQRRMVRSTESRQRPVWSTGISPLDELLPEGGIRSGSLIEWLSDPGEGAATLAWLMAAHLQSSRSLVVVDPHKECFPPGIAYLGVNLRRVLVVQPKMDVETLWTLEQSLRSPAGCIVIARLERISQQTYRRLQLAVERGGGIGLLLRPSRYRDELSWADVRLGCASTEGGWSCSGKSLERSSPTGGNRSPSGSLARRVEVQLLRVRGGGFQQRTIPICIDDDARVVPVDSQLAGAATQSPAARAS